MEQPSLSQIKIVEYLTIISENYGREISTPLQARILKELSYMEPDQIERGFIALLREGRRKFRGRV